MRWILGRGHKPKSTANTTKTINLVASIIGEVCVLCNLYITASFQRAQGAKDLGSLQTSVSDIWRSVDSINFNIQKLDTKIERFQQQVNFRFEKIEKDIFDLYGLNAQDARQEALKACLVTHASPIKITSTGQNLLVQTPIKSVVGDAISKNTEASDNAIMKAIYENVGGISGLKRIESENAKITNISIKAIVGLALYYADELRSKRKS